MQTSSDLYKAFSVNYRFVATDGSEARVNRLTQIRHSSYEDYMKGCQEYLTELKTEWNGRPDFKIVSHTYDSEYDLIAKMRATRILCELGHRVRTEAKIRNRQPLKTAYVLFSDDTIQQWMMVATNQSKEYAQIIADELNVLEVVFVEGNTSQFFNLQLKPNFRSLGARGLGKEASALKKDLADLSFDQRREFWQTLNADGETEIGGVKINRDDVLVDYLPKNGFASAADKVGAIVLDITLTPELLDKGFVSEFRSFVQSIRKDNNLQLTNRIQLEIECCDSIQKLLIANADALKKALLITDFTFRSLNLNEMQNSHSFSLDGKNIKFLLFLVK